MVDLKTLNSLAAKWGIAVHRLEYLVRARNIAPVAWVGHTRIFDDDGVARIEEELSTMSKSRVVVTA